LLIKKSLLGTIANLNFKSDISAKSGSVRGNPAASPKIALASLPPFPVKPTIPLATLRELVVACITDIADIAV